MAEARIDIVVNDNSINGLESKLQKLQSELKKTSIGSTEFKKLSNEIKGVQTQLDNANSSLQRFDIGAAVGNASKILGGLAAGITALSVLFVDAEDDTEALAEAQQRLAASFGIVQAAEAIATIFTLTNTAAIVENTVATQAAFQESLKRQAAVTTAAGAEQALTAALTEAGIAFTVNTDAAAKYDLTIGQTNLELKALNGQIIATNVETLEQVLVYDAATGSIVQYDEAVLGATVANTAAAKSTNVLSKALKFLGSPGGIIFIVTAAIVALYLAIDSLTESFKESITVAQYGTAIEDIGSIVDSAVGSFDDATQKVVAYQSALRQGILTAEQRAEAEETVREALINSGIAQDDVNRIIDAGVNSVEAYIAVLPKLLEQQVLFQALSNAYSDLLAIQTDVSASAPSFWQTTGNLILSFGNQWVYTIKQAQTTAENFNGAVEDTQKQIDILLERFEKTLSENQGILDGILYGKGKDKNTAKKQIQDISKEILSLVRKATTDEIEASTEGYEEKIRLREQDGKNEIEDLNNRLQEVLKATDITEKQKREFSDATTKAIAASRKKLNDDLKQLYGEDAKEFVDQLKDIIDEAQDGYDELYDRILAQTASFYSQEEQLLRAQLLKNQITEAEFDQKILDARLDAAESEFNATKNLAIKNRGAINSELETLQGRTDEASIDRRKELYEELEKIDKDLVIATRDFETQKLEIENDRIEATLEAEEKAADETKEIQEKKAEEFANYVQGITDIIVGALDVAIQYYASQEELLNIRLQQDLASLDSQLEAAQTRFDTKQQQIDKSTVLSAKARENAIAQLEEQRLAEEKRIAQERERLEKKAAKEGLILQSKQAKASLAIGIAQAISDAAIGISAATAQAPLTFGASLALIAPIAATLAAAIGSYAAQQAAINAQLGSLGFAEGGFVSGPGSGTSDSVPARLSNGEFVVNAASTANNLPLLEEINSTGSQNSSLTAVLNELRGEIESLRSQPVKAYVVTSELDEVNRTEEYISRRAQL